MSDTSILQVLDGLSEVANFLCSVLLLQLLELFQVVKQRSLLHEFQDDINMLCVVKDSIDFHDKWMK